MISLFLTKQVLVMPFYSGLASPLLSLMPKATKGGGRGGGEDPGNTGNIITGFIFNREITTIVTSL